MGYQESKEVGQEFAGATASGRLPVYLRCLAALNRRMPTEVRKVEMLSRKLYEVAGGGGWKEDEAVDLRWPKGRQPPIRGRIHGLKMRLDLRDWAERRTYFTGRHFQRDLEDLLTQIVAPGDQFIDVGANIGMISLLLAHLVGPSGRGFSFEPNPLVFQRLQDHLQDNGVTNVRAISTALGAEPGSAMLCFPGRHSGVGTLAHAAVDAGNGIAVSVARLDDFAGDLTPGRATHVKMDVEGYEYQVLRGMDALLRRPETSLVIEVTDSMLRGAGATAAALYELLYDYGYSSFRWRRILARWHTRIELQKTSGPGGDRQCDVLFVREDSTLFRQRVGPMLR